MNIPTLAAYIAAKLAYFAFDAAAFVATHTELEIKKMEYYAHKHMDVALETLALDVYENGNADDIAYVYSQLDADEAFEFGKLMRKHNTAPLRIAA
jgi:hypothetical protein